MDTPCGKPPQFRFQFSGESPQTIRTDAVDFRYAPDPPGIVTLYKFQFVGLLDVATKGPLV